MANSTDNDFAIRTPESIKKIRTPRAATATILSRSGSGPAFAGDEDRYFLDGIEEVLATWQPEVGGMPPIDNKAMELPPREFSKIRTPPMKVKAMRAVLRDTNHEESELEISDASVEPPRFEGIDDGVFLDGLEEVVPDGNQDGLDPAVVQSDMPVVFIKPQDIPILAVSSGHIRAPKWHEVGDDTQNTAAEGPEFHGREDAVFHEGVEEVVAGWDSPASPGRAATTSFLGLDSSSPFAPDLAQASELEDSRDIEDGFFHEGLEEVSTHNPDADLVGFMPPVDVPELPREACPPRITTGTNGRLPPTPEHDEVPPTWDEDNDATFLDPDALTDSPIDVQRTISNPFADLILPRKKPLRVRTYSKDELTYISGVRAAYQNLPQRATQSLNMLPFVGDDITPTNDDQ